VTEKQYLSEKLIFSIVAFRWIIRFTYPYTLNKCFLQIMGCPFGGERRVNVKGRKGAWGWGEKCPFYKACP